MMAECYLLQSVKCPLYNWTEVLGFFMFKYVDIFKKMLKICFYNINILCGQFRCPIKHRDPVKLWSWFLKSVSDLILKYNKKLPDVSLECYVAVFFGCSR